MDAMYGDANTGYIKMRASMKDGKYEYRIINACMPVTSGEEVKAIVDDFISRTTNRSKISENRSKINEIRSRPAAGRKKHHRWTDEERQDAIRRYAAGEDIDKIALDYGSTNMAIQKMMQKYKVRRPRIKPAAQPPVQPDPDLMMTRQNRNENVISKSTESAIRNHGIYKNLKQVKHNENKEPIQKKEQVRLAILW